MRWFVVVAVIVLLTACQSESDSNTVNIETNGIVLDIYKTETCGCCGIWADYMQAKGYTVNIHHPADLNQIKQQYGIDPQWQSCHTAVSDGGYVFEGHIPERFVKQFIEQAPMDAVGLVVPGMPLGSPGMEMGDRFMAYDISVLKKDGSVEVYASIQTASDQF